MDRVLLVANKTLASEEVSAYVRTRMAKGPCEFTLLVPATTRWDREPAASRLASGLAGGLEGPAPKYEKEDNFEFARSRLEFGLGILRDLGATVHGDVGDPNPAKAITEVMQREHFDEVALSTLPKRVSRWLGLDIPRQVERKFKVPVTVIKVQGTYP